MLTKLNNMKVGNKVYAIVGLCLLALVGVASVATYQMWQIGRELVGIAERDLPLTEILTKVTTHQLEQAIVLERAFRYGEEMTRSSHAGELFIESVTQFEALGKKVHEEFVTAKEMSDRFITEAITEAGRKEFMHVSEVVARIDVQHTAYEAEAKAIMELLADGQVARAVQAEEALIVTQDAFVKELEDLLLEVEEFTLDTARTAEAHERFALLLLVVISVIAIAGGAGASWFLVNASIVKPISDVVGSLTELTDGNTDVKVTVHADDEIGTVAKALEIFREKLVQNIEMQKQADAAREAELQRAKRLEELNNEFDARIRALLGEVDGATKTLNGTANSMESVAERTKEQATTVAAASEESATNAQSISAATEELDASVAEIGRQVQKSAEIANQAVEETRRANTTVQGLADASDKIGEVISLINDIAEQTNLLALNATIEAARAGDAGKGFAVVASEVKTLASQTASATEEIANQISGMQGATTQAVEAIGGITKTIDTVNEIAGTIASAVEEQGAATREIGGNAVQAAEAAQEVSKNISGVTDGSDETSRAVHQVLESISQLATQSKGLDQAVQRYLADVNAA